MCLLSVLYPCSSEPLHAGEEKQTAPCSRGSPVSRRAWEGARLPHGHCGGQPGGPECSLESAQWAS